MALRIEWDKFEVALLIDAWEQVLAKKESKVEIVSHLSAALRTRAMNSGIEIDDKYRNENGISLQMTMIAYLLTDGKVGLPGASKLFVDIANLKKQHPFEYDALLRDAKEKILGKKIEGELNTKEHFIQWLSGNNSPKYSTETIVQALEEGSEYCYTHKICNERFWDIHDGSVFASVTSKLLGRKFFRLTHRKTAIVLDKAIPLYKEFLNIIHLFEERSIAIEDIPETESTPVVIPQNRRLMDSLEKTIDYLKTRYDVRLHYDHLSNPNRRSSCDMLYKVKNCRKDIMWVYLIDKKNSHYISIETEPEYLKCMEIDTSGFYRIQIRGTHPCQKMFFEDYGSIQHSLVSICDSIDSFFTEPAFIQKKVDSTRLNILLKSAFPHGIRLGSVRDIMRFRLAAEEEQIDLPEDDEVLKRELMKCGTIIDDKLFAKSENMVDELRNKVEAVFADGFVIIYYEALFYAEQEWMEQHHIFSDDILKDVLKRELTDYNYTRVFFTKDEKKTEFEAVSEELKRVWGDNAVAEIRELSKKLPFVPQDNIQRVLSATPYFVCVSEGNYILIDRVVVSDQEAEDIIEYVTISCQKNGFASLADIPLGSIAESNSFAAGNALYTAIYNKLLKDKFHNNGKILTTGRSTMRIVSILSREFREREEISFDEVNNKVTELNGGSKRQDTFEILYNNFIRISEKRFVSPRKVHFDVEETDQVLSEIYKNGFGAIRDVTTFAMFPICGVSWNLYVLESYCYKYSSKYCLSVLNFNSKNAGIIAERKLHYTHDHMLAIALARSKEELTEEVAGKFFFQQGLMAKRTYAKLPGIVKEAELLRKEK